VLIGSAHTCGGLAALASSRQRPQTEWQQITFKSQKKDGRGQSRREKALHPLLGIGGGGLLAGGLAGNVPRLSFIPETWGRGPTLEVDLAV